jgi:endonuclease-8
VPEGDTIRLAANRLRPALLDRTLVRLTAPRAGGSRPHPGVRITEVEAYGKHLLIRFSDGHLLRTHLGMTGRWDLYRRDQRWRQPAHLARAIVEVDDHVAVCFSAPTVEIRRERPAGPAAAAGSSSPAPPLAHLGPDLCRPDADIDLALARMAAAAAPDRSIADVLLDQRVAAGVGNAFKSEVLWSCRVHPLTPLGAIDEPTRRRLLVTASRQLQASVATGRRTTVPGRPGSLAVYGRARRPCPRCGTNIESDRLGAERRPTYWCPACQPPPASG